MEQDRVKEVQVEELVCVGMNMAWGSRQEGTKGQDGDLSSRSHVNCS